MGKRVRLVDMLNVWRHFPVPSFEDTVMTVCGMTSDRLSKATYKRLLAAWETLPLLVLVWLSHWNPRTGLSWPGGINVCRKYHVGHDRLYDALDMARKLGLMRREDGPGNRAPYSFPLLQAIARTQESPEVPDAPTGQPPRRKGTRPRPEYPLRGDHWARLKERLGVSSLGTMIAKQPGPETEEKIRQAMFEIFAEDDARRDQPTPKPADGSPDDEPEDEQWPT